MFICNRRLLLGNPQQKGITETLKQLETRFKNRVLIPQKKTVSPATDVLKNLETDKVFESLNPDIQEYLKQMKIKTPSEIQRITIPHLLQRKSAVFAAQTGSGKTLAYLLPICHLLKVDQHSQRRGDGHKDNVAEPKENRPRAVILVPSKELVSQVLSVTKSISHHHKLLSVGLRSDYKMKRLKKSLQQPIDVLVTTPGIFVKLHEGLKTPSVYFSSIKYVIVDEADSLLAKGFEEEVASKILQPCKNLLPTRDTRVQFVFCMASFGHGIVEFLDREFPNIPYLTAPNVHKTVKNVKHDFINIKGVDKLKKLLEILKEDKESSKIIFCNTIKSCQAVDYCLSENNFVFVGFHSDMPPKMKLNNFREFSTGACSILISTDIAARGIDIKHVERIIMFDFPESAVEYLHRAGRTGRMGASGRVTSLVSKKDEELAGVIENAIRSGQSLEGLTSDRKINEATKKQKLMDKLERKRKGKRFKYFVENNQLSKPTNQPFNVKTTSRQVVPIAKAQKLFPSIAHPTAGTRKKPAADDSSTSSAADVKRGKNFNPNAIVKTRLSSPPESRKKFGKAASSERVRRDQIYDKKNSTRQSDNSSSGRSNIHPPNKTAASKSSNSGDKKISSSVRSGSTSRIANKKEKKQGNTVVTAA